MRNYLHLTDSALVKYSGTLFSDTPFTDAYRHKRCAKESYVQIHVQCFVCKLARSDFISCQISETKNAASLINYKGMAFAKRMMLQYHGDALQIILSVKTCLMIRMIPWILNVYCFNFPSFLLKVYHPRTYPGK